MTGVPGPLPAEVDEALGRLEELVRMVEEHPDATVREAVLEMLSAVDTIHRGALRHLRGFLEARTLLDDAASDPHIGLLFGLYDEPEDDEWSRAEAALDRVRPYVESHGGELEIVAADDGQIQIRLLGACENCSASSATLRGVVEEALRAELPDFAQTDLSQPPTRTALPIYAQEGHGCSTCG